MKGMLKVQLEGKEKNRDIDESIDGEQLSKRKSLAGRLERVTKGVSSGFSGE